jgi:hypothetical protein
MRAGLAAARRLALQRREHLDHVAVALARERSVRERLVLAERVAGGLSGPALRRAAARHERRLERVRGEYARVWLRHNKRPNIEVSLAAFDAVRNSLRVLGAPAPAFRPGFRPLDLAWDAFEPAVAGVPLAPAVCDGVPFLFAGRDRTHVCLADRRVVTVPFAATRVRDLRLLCAGFYLPADAGARHPILDVRLLRQGRCVFVETLLAVRHICDWFAPRGEHMWAGGGLRHADARRVTFALAAGPYHGVLHLRGFRTRGCLADAVEFRARSVPGAPRAGVALFAATVAVRSPRRATTGC